MSANNNKINLKNQLRKKYKISTARFRHIDFILALKHKEDNIIGRSCNLNLYTMPPSMRSNRKEQRLRNIIDQK